MLLPFALFLAAAVVMADGSAGGSSAVHPTPQGIEAALATAAAGGKYPLGGSNSVSGGLLQEFYIQRGFEPAWIRFGIPDRQAWRMLAAARNSGADGLDPEAYHAAALDSLLRLFHRKIFLRERVPAGAALELELLLSDAFLGLGAHLLSGSTPSAAAPDPWHDRREPFDLPRFFQAALSSGTDIRSALSGLAPQDPEYGKLKGYLAEYRRIRESGGWAAVQGGANLGMIAGSPGLHALCRRLQAEGDMQKGTCPDSLTAGMGTAMKHFQARHGLDTTGIIRKPDLVQLNTGVDRRIAQIEANLEYRRWLPRDPGKRSIRVNIADFRLTAWDSTSASLGMKVVIGRKEDSTPVFRDRITAIELNPAWNVPDNIAREEILPELRKDPAYLGKHGMELLTGWGEPADTISPESIDWPSRDEGDFRFRIRQKAGPGSALGRLKFALGNPFNIYLHDTPAASYFDRSERALSHGCVRLEKPVELAVWALGDPERWSREALLGEIAKGATKTIRVPDGGIPVFILYWTAFVDEAGRLNFRKDIYARDYRRMTRITAAGAD